MSKAKKSKMAKSKGTLFSSAEVDARRSDDAAAAQRGMLGELRTLQADRTTLRTKVDRMTTKQSVVVPEDPHADLVQLTQKNGQPLAESPANLEPTVVQVQRYMLHRKDQK